MSLSTGAALVILGADTALNWVLENHDAPCGAGVPAAECPPIKVTNNSYGPSGGGEFDPESATVKLQQALAAEGVVTVWANGNDGGDGSASLSNPPGMDPTAGVISVASYNDLGTGTRDGEVSEFSSRGQDGDFSTYPDISAPGDMIASSCRLYLPICSTGLDPQDNGDFNTISGTSMAAPHIAGIVAQLFQDSPGADPGAGRDGDPHHGVQVLLRSAVRRRPGRCHDVLRQGRRTGRRRRCRERTASDGTGPRRPGSVPRVRFLDDAAPPTT